MNIKLSNSLKIKLNNSGQGSGANFDYDFQIIVIDKTKKPYKKKLLSRQDMIRINAPLNGSCAIKTIDDFIEWLFVLTLHYIYSLEMIQLRIGTLRNNNGKLLNKISRVPLPLNVMAL
jgi:hypothetical protein